MRNKRFLYELNHSKFSIVIKFKNIIDNEFLNDYFSASNQLQNTCIHL